jgi:hypothetical protein
MLTNILYVRHQPASFFHVGTRFSLDLPPVRVDMNGSARARRLASLLRRDLPEARHHAAPNPLAPLLPTVVKRRTSFAQWCADLVVQPLTLTSSTRTRPAALCPSTGQHDDISCPGPKHGVLPARWSSRGPATSRPVWTPAFAGHSVRQRPKGLRTRGQGGSTCSFR